MQKWRSWEAASDSEWGLALEREAVIRPLAEQGRLSVAAIDEAADRLRLSRSVLYDLLRRYRRRPQTSSLLPWKRGRGTHDRVLAPAEILDGYGVLGAPSVAAMGLKASDIGKIAASPRHPPGFYGPENGRRALNLGDAVPQPEAASRPSTAIP